mgnify:CR=1 FL=1
MANYNLWKNGMEFIDNTLIEDFSNDGAVLCRGFFLDWLDPLRIGVDKLIQNPSVRERSYVPNDGSAPFFQDLVNWNRIPEFRDFVFKSRLGYYAAKLMKSNKSRLFHDHVLVKEPGSSIVTPWHQDKPYYCVDGNQSVSFWIALDDISKEGCLECIAGSHLSNILHKPKRFNGNDLYENDNSKEVPDINSNRKDYEILSWDIKAGDAVAFDFRTLHGASENINKINRRRVFSARIVGDDAFFVDRQGKGSPPFESIKLKTGDKLTGREFPVIYEV